MTKSGTDTEFMSFYLCRVDIKITLVAIWESSLAGVTTDYTITVRAAVRAVRIAGIKDVLQRHLWSIKSQPEKEPSVQHKP